MTRVTRDPT